MIKVMRATPSSTHPAYRPDIDGMRAIAVLGVVFYHAFPESLPGGFLGVDVFFVISGFLIGSILQRSFDANVFSFSNFYARRIRRIFPALVVVLVSCLIAGYFILLPDEYRQLGKHVAAGSAFIANFSYWSESGYFDTLAETKPLLHLWSLAIEEQFYLIWPMALWLAYKIRFNFIFLTALVIVLSFLTNIYQTEADQATAFFLLPSRAWELLFGSVLAWYHLKNPNRDDAPFKNSAGVVGLLLLIGPMFAAIPVLSFPGWYALLPVVGAVLVIYAGPASFTNRVILSRKLMVWVGLISFPLYLWHWPLLSFASIMESETPNITIRSYAVVLAVVCAAATFYIVETPIRSIRASKKLITILSAAAFLMFSVGMVIWKDTRNSDVDSIAFMKEAQALCKKQFPQLSSISENVCRMSKTNGNTIALIGDSHAGHLFYGISKSLKGNEGAVLFSASCAAPYINTSTALRTPEFRGKRENAYKVINEAYEYVSGQDSIKTVILAHLPECSYNDTIDRESQEDLSAALAMENGIKRSVEKLMQAGKSIVIILSNPMTPFNIENCITRPYRLTDKEEACSFDSKHHLESKSYQEYKNIVMRVASLYPNVLIVDTSEVFCDSASCSIEKDGRLLYSSRSHLNEAGSRAAAEFVLKSIEGFGALY